MKSVDLSSQTHKLNHSEIMRHGEFGHLSKAVLRLRVEFEYWLV